MADVTLWKVDPGTHRTVYEVRLGGRVVGYVWSREGFSYRGTKGWNRALRLRDYHPIEWRYGRTLAYPGVPAFNRITAVRELLAEVRRGTPG